MNFFLDYSPLIKGAFLGLGKCIIWAKLGGAWDTEVACYENNVIKILGVVPAGEDLQGSMIMSTGDSISWLVNKDGSYQLGLVPVGAPSQLKTGQF